MKNTQVVWAVFGNITWDYGGYMGVNLKLDSSADCLARSLIYLQIDANQPTRC